MPGDRGCALFASGTVRCGGPVTSNGVTTWVDQPLSLTGVRKLVAATGASTSSAFAFVTPAGVMGLGRLGAITSLGGPQPAVEYAAPVLLTQLIGVRDVILGDGDTGAKVKRVVLGAPFSVLWGMPAEFDSLHLDEARLPLPALMNLLGTGSGKLPLTAAAFTASGLVLATEPNLRPPLGVEAKVSAGQLVEFTAQANDADSGKVTVGGTRGTGAWTVTSGNTANINIDQPASATSSVAAAQSGTFTLMWTVTLNGCVGNDQVNIQFNSSPTLSNLVRDCDAANENFTTIPCNSQTVPVRMPTLGAT